MQKIKIISGGQTGVDRAALDFALEHLIDCGGWCPKGRRAEDGIIPNTYPLVETQSIEYPIRTRMNIMDSDATLILFLDKMDRGTLLTQKNCKTQNKHCWVQNMNERFELEKFQAWIDNNSISILNIAGPRESFAPEIYLKSKMFLQRLLF